MPCDLFLCCYRCWVTDRLMETEEGRKQLEDARRLKRTKLDRAGLARLMREM